MKGNFKSELKTVLKVAKLEYFYKFFTSLSIRALLLIIPVYLVKLLTVLLRVILIMQLYFFLF